MNIALIYDMEVLFFVNQTARNFAIRSSFCIKIKNLKNASDLQTTSKETRIMYPCVEELDNCEVSFVDRRPKIHDNHDSADSTDSGGKDSKVTHQTDPGGTSFYQGICNQILWCMRCVNRIGRNWNTDRKATTERAIQSLIVVGHGSSTL